MQPTPIPNNLGPTLLLVVALLLLPLGIGLPLLLLSLAQVRTWQDQPAFPRLHRNLGRLLRLLAKASWTPVLPPGPSDGN